MAKPGRPERSKASYKAEINKLKKKNADLVASTDMLYTIIDQDTERFRKWIVWSSVSVPNCRTEN